MKYCILKYQVINNNIIGFQTLESPPPAVFPYWQQFMVDREPTLHTLIDSYIYKNSESNGNKNDSMNTMDSHCKSPWVDWNHSDKMLVSCKEKH